MAIERIVQQGRSGNGSGSTGASWGPSVVQSSDVGRVMICAILHQEVATDWTANWRYTGNASPQQTLTVVQELAVSSHRLRISVLENVNAATAASAHIHLGGTSCRFLAYTAYYRNVDDVNASYIIGSDTEPQTDTKTLSGLASVVNDVIVSMIGVIGLRNGTAVAPMSDQGNYQQNGTGTDTSMDIGRIEGDASTSMGWDYSASHHWLMGGLVLNPIITILPRSQAIMIG